MPSTSEGTSNSEVTSNTAVRTVPKPQKQSTVNHPQSHSHKQQTNHPSNTQSNSNNNNNNQNRNNSIKQIHIPQSHNNPQTNGTTPYHQSHQHNHSCCHEKDGFHETFVYNKVDPHISYANKSKYADKSNNFTQFSIGTTFGSFQGFSNINNHPNPSNNLNTFGTSNTFNTNTNNNNNNKNNHNNNKNKPKKPNPTIAPTQGRTNPLNRNQRRHNRRRLVNSNLNKLNPSIRQQNKWDKIPFYYDFATKSYYNKFDTQFEEKRLLNRMGRSMYTKDEQCPKIMLVNITIHPDESDSYIIDRLAQFTEDMQQNGNNHWLELQPEDISQVHINREPPLTQIPPQPSQSSSDEKQNIITSNTQINHNNNNNKNNNSSSTEPSESDSDIDIQDTAQISHPSNNSHDTDSNNINQRTHLNPHRAQHIIHVPNNKSPYFYLPHTTYVDQHGNIIPKSKLSIHRTNSLIITLNPHGPFMTKYNNTWQQKLRHNLPKTSPLGDQISLIFKQPNQIYEFYMILNNIRIPDQDLKVNIYDIINNDRINKNNPINPQNIIAIKKWTMSTNNKISVFMQGTPPANFPTQVGVKPWRIIPISLPSDTLTKAQKRAKQIPFCKACLNIGHYIYQCSRFKAAKNKFRQQMKNKYKNNNKLINEHMRNWRFTNNICQNCGQYGHPAHTCNNQSYCKRCQSHDHPSKFDFNCGTIQQAALTTFKYEAQWNQIINNNEPLPQQPPPSALGNINQQWIVPQTFLQISKDLGPPIPTLPTTSQQLVTSINTPFTNNTPRSTQRSNRRTSATNKPAQPTKQPLARQGNSTTNTPHSNRSKKRLMQELNDTFDEEDADFKNDPSNAYLMSNDPNTKPAKRQRHTHNYTNYTNYNSSNQHQFIINELDQDQNMPDAYVKIFQNEKTKNINQIDHGHQPNLTPNMTHPKPQNQQPPTQTPNPSNSNTKNNNTNNNNNTNDNNNTNNKNNTNNNNNTNNIRHQHLINNNTNNNNTNHNNNNIHPHRITTSNGGTSH